MNQLDRLPIRSYFLPALLALATCASCASRRGGHDRCRDITVFPVRVVSGGSVIPEMPIADGPDVVFNIEAKDPTLLVEVPVAAVVQNGANLAQILGQVTASTQVTGVQKTALILRELVTNHACPEWPTYVYEDILESMEWLPPDPDDPERRQLIITGGRLLEPGVRQRLRESTDLRFLGTKYGRHVISPRAQYGGIRSGYRFVFDVHLKNLQTVLANVDRVTITVEARLLGDFVSAELVLPKLQR